ncbi:MAG: SDR family oxidoreductase, partial [Rhodospirillaceae bacterium]|nr:SDR family oxidoreductase [Rhodospirillaceae bacterium]
MPTALVTGASRGLGLEFVRQYAAAGWRVHAACRDPDKAAALRAVAGDVTMHRLDVDEAAQVQALAASLSGEAIDLLVNNAGIGGDDRTASGAMDYETWDRVIRTNVFAPHRVAEAFVPHVERSQRRVILFVSSRAGSIGSMLSGGRHIYRSSKAALNAVVKMLAIDLMPKRVVCVAVHPGWVRTDMGGGLAPLDATTSITALRALVERLESHHNGHF